MKTVTTYATLYPQRRFSRRLSGNRWSNQAELPRKVLDFREFENEIGIRNIKYNETKFS